MNIRNILKTTAVVLGTLAVLKMGANVPGISQIRNLVL